ncbi:hypothetical protein [Agromyces sp. Leaf222]|uniref:hypothetical protein n=1 Tax=Agromyces sp. Leaf222 TaxID=1735688 RepID=UPI0006FB3C81|nr:hypothetical protein [Agromyces sp. Leaf222]KQM84228.1 hypothetical protein ASE68_14315 [Agromyces sp. Leaf222]
MHKRTVAIAALAAAATIVGALVLVPSALSGVALGSEAPEPSAAAVTIDFAALPYTNGLAAEQEAAAAASERARLEAEAEAAEAARVAAEAAAAQAAADEAARVAAEQAWAEQVAVEEAEAAAEQAAAEEAAAQPSVDPCIVVADAEGNYYPCGCHDLSCSYR